MKKLFKNAMIVMNKEIKLSDVLINNSIIEKISENIFPEDDMEVIDVEKNYLLPAFIDVHIHGANGSDVMDKKEENLRIISKYLASEGTGNFLATTLTSTREELTSSLQACANLLDKEIDGATLFGVHMEGPYFDAIYKGAQNDKYMVDATIKELEYYISIKEGLIKMFSISPHTKANKEAIKYLTKKNIISSVGHSAASFEDVAEAVKYGLSHATHTYNGMKGFTHREPGVVGAVFNFDEINAEIIFDKVHVHPEAVRTLIKIKGVDKVICITDSMSATGLSNGKYKLGELDVNVLNGEARLASNNALAGSVLTMDRAFRNLISIGYSMVDAVKMTATNAAKEFKLNTGMIEEEKNADLIIMDKNLNVLRTYVKGNLKYKK